MSSSRRPLALIFTAALLAGCGGASGSSDSSPAQNAASNSTNGELRVGVTDGGIGTAARGDKRGLEQLPSGTVEKPSNTQQGVGAGASCQNTDIAPVADALATVVDSTLCLLNGEREDAGLAPLTENPKLASAAIAHSREMVDKQYFDHAGRDGTDPVARIRSAGYIPDIGTWTVGENLAWGTGTLATPKEIVQAWMASTGHRENILRPTFREIGFGVVVGNPRSTNGAGATYTTTFGGVTTPAPAATPKQVKTSRKHKARKARRSARRARAARARKARATVSRGRARAKIATPSGSH